MAEYSGYYQYVAGSGLPPQEGPCRIALDPETLTLAPENAAPITIDLGDLAGVGAANFQIRLPLDSGATLVLRQLGKSCDRVARDLLESYRQRAVGCLLLEDMQEVARFSGAFELFRSAAGCPSCGARNRGTKFCGECGYAVASPAPAPAPACAGCKAPLEETARFCPKCGQPVEGSRQPAPQSGEAEVRLYETNLAILPSASQGFQWRLADIEAVRFAEGSLEIVVEAGENCLRLYQLARRTDECAQKVRNALSTVNAKSAQVLHAMFPFLGPEKLQATTGLWREGHAAAVPRLNAIDGRMGATLAANAIDADLKPYYEELLKRTVDGLLFAGYKLIRPEENDTTGEAENDGEPVDADENGPETLYWFFFPLATNPGSSALSNLVAWEATSRSGRATYLFRLVEPAQQRLLQDPAQRVTLVQSAVYRLNRVLAMLNFRRRPIYLSDRELQTNPLFHRYAIACRRIPEVQSVRASFVGRALHVSPESWLEQLSSMVTAENGSSK